MVGVGLGVCRGNVAPAGQRDDDRYAIGRGAATNLCVCVNKPAIGKAAHCMGREGPVA